MCQQDTALFYVLLDAQEKVEFIFAKFREWWTPRIRNHNAAFYAVLTKQIGEIQFCRVPQVVAIVNMLSLQSAFFVLNTTKKAEIYFCSTVTYIFRSKYVRTHVYDVETHKTYPAFPPKGEYLLVLFFLLLSNVRYPLFCYIRISYFKYIEYFYL